MSVKVRPFVSPSMVLLAMDWSGGSEHPDFLGFAIRRTPGFYHEPISWLPNRIGFHGPATGKDFPSNECPIQKFMWWDSRFGLEDHGDIRKITYEVFPCTGKEKHIELNEHEKAIVNLTMPPHQDGDIGTWFNRAVVSSQAFSRKLTDMGLIHNQKPTPEQEKELRSWLSNGLAEALEAFILKAETDEQELAGVIYHLTDTIWEIPAFKSAGKKIPIDLVYDAHPVVNKDKTTSPPPTQVAVDALNGLAQFHPRLKTNIMHDKFLVEGRRLNDERRAACRRMQTGSANFTSEGVSQQANVIHIFNSPDLATIYRERYELLKDDPAKAATAQRAGWSDEVEVGDAQVSVFFSPEPGKHRESMDTIVESIKKATDSVLFCLFSSTDAPLRDACFELADKGKMMFGLVNNVVEKDTVKPGHEAHADDVAGVELYHRSREKHDVIGAGYFNANDLPEGFQSENQLFPGEGKPPFPPVIIHHKFIIIDGETDHSVIYSGSANLSKNSTNNNDENLLEIKGSRKLADIYVAEFFRLYEHYRARATLQKPAAGGKTVTAKLATDRDGWAKKFYTPRTPECKGREALLGLEVAPQHA